MTCTHRKVVDYRVITAICKWDSVEKLEKEVRKCINEGYEPIGGGSFFSDNCDKYVSQPMVKYSECPNHPDLDEEEQEIEDNFEFMELQKKFYRLYDNNGVIFLIPKTFEIEDIQTPANKSFYMVSYIDLSGKTGSVLIENLGNLKQFYEEN